jgi:protein gp37
MATTTTNHGTGIEWTHVPGYKGETWNPVRGCTKISPGCKHCYAETFAERWRGVAGHPYEQGFDLRLVPEKLDEPLRATAPRAYFVNSMSDLHQDGVDAFFLRQTYAVMQACSQHLFMVLTKRALGMQTDIGMMSMTRQSDISVAGRDILGAYQRGTYPSNVWLGVSVEDRKYGLPRVDILRTIPAAVRFLSVEPLLEDLGGIDLTGIHWVIVGGESGTGARPLEESWALRIRDQCAEQDVPFFFKQWGGINKKLLGNMLQGRQHLAFPKAVQPCV